MFHTCKPDTIYLCVFILVCGFVCACVYLRTYMWRMPLTGAPGQPVYLTHEHHNLITPEKAVANSSKNCKARHALATKLLR